MKKREHWVSGLRKQLEPFARHFHYVALVGSVAREQHHEGSDLDVIAIARKPFDSRVFKQARLHLESNLQIPVDFIVYAQTEGVVRDDDYLDNDIADAVDIIGAQKDDLKVCRFLWKQTHA